ncbi:hypothetical protein D3C85_1569070 [compost metagenome]
MKILIRTEEVKNRNVVGKIESLMSKKFLNPEDRRNREKLNLKKEESLPKKIKEETIKTGL